MTRVEAGRAPRSGFAQGVRILASRKGALCGFLIVGLMALAALLAPLIAPYDPLDQNIMDRLKPPSAEHWLGTD